MPLGGDVRDDDLGRPARLAVAAAVRVANDLVGRGHIDVLRVARRMEHDAEGPLQVLGEDLGRRRRASGRVGGEDQDASAPAFRHEDVAVRGDPDDAGLVQAPGEHLHREALRHIRHLALRRFDDLRHVARNPALRGRSQ